MQVLIIHILMLVVQMSAPHIVQVQVMVIAEEGRLISQTIIVVVPMDHIQEIQMDILQVAVI